MIVSATIGVSVPSAGPHVSHILKWAPFCLEDCKDVETEEVDLEHGPHSLYSRRLSLAGPGVTSAVSGPAPVARSAASGARASTPGATGRPPEHHCGEPVCRDIW